MKQIVIIVLALTLFSNARANSQSNWQTAPSVSILPAPVDSVQARRFYAVLPLQQNYTSDHEKWIEIKVAGAKNAYFARCKNAFSPTLQDDDALLGTIPPTDRLSVSPAVADYLNLSESSKEVEWRMADSVVRPGMWLKWEEQAVLSSINKEADAASPGSAPSTHPLTALRVLYVITYSEIAAGHKAVQAGDFKKALAIYTEALDNLNSLREKAPFWEQALVTQRFYDLRAKLVDLMQKKGISSKP